MTDLINRTEALNAINIGKTLEEAFRNVTKLPSAQPEQQWIPCGERMPEETGSYMATVDCGKQGLATGQRYYHGTVLGWDDKCVIAWMPLPEPWEGEK